MLATGEQLGENLPISSEETTTYQLSGRMRPQYIVGAKEFVLIFQTNFPFQ
jgi:hypothetical protein